MSTVESRIAGGTSKRNAGDKNKKIALAVMAVIFVALLACWLPTRRALRVEPAVALRID